MLSDHFAYISELVLVMIVLTGDVFHKLWCVTYLLTIVMWRCWRASRTACKPISVYISIVTYWAAARRLKAPVQVSRSLSQRRIEYNNNNNNNNNTLLLHYYTTNRPSFCRLHQVKPGLPKRNRHELLCESFSRPDGLPVSRPTVSKYWTENLKQRGSTEIRRTASVRYDKIADMLNVFFICNLIKHIWVHVCPQAQC